MTTDASSRGSMLPPVSDDADRATGQALAQRRARADEGGEPDGARSLDHELLDLEQQVDRLLDGVVAAR